MGKSVVYYPTPGGGAVPVGGVILWSGAVSGVPKGWALCNGQNGTPDLRDRFVVGAGNSYVVGSRGGEDKHTLTVVEMPSHSHSVPSDSFSAGSGAHTLSEGTRTSNSGSSGGSQPHENRPPYFALCYIMKL